MVGSGNTASIDFKQGGGKSRFSPRGCPSGRGHMPRRAGRNRPRANRFAMDRGPPRSKIHNVKQRAAPEQQICSRGAERPSFALARPPRGADGAPRGAPGVGPHAYRVAWGALARRRSGPAPRDDRLLALQPWRLFSPGSPPSLKASAGKPAIAWRRWAPPPFSLPGCLGAWVPGRREPRSPYRAVTSRCGGDATILLRLRDRLRRRPSNEQD